MQNEGSVTGGVGLDYGLKKSIRWLIDCLLSGVLN
jgi:hypothetical protein